MASEWFLSTTKLSAASALTAKSAAATVVRMDLMNDSSCLRRGVYQGARDPLDRNERSYYFACHGRPQSEILLALPSPLRRARPHADAPQLPLPRPRRARHRRMVLRQGWHLAPRC